MDSFLQYLILFLIALLFAREYIPAILGKFGIKVGNGNGNGSTYQAQIDELKKHAQVANEEMGEIRDDVGVIKTDIAYIRGKLDK